MREFTKSLFSYALAVSLFPIRQAQNAFNTKDDGEHEGAATRAAMAVANATADQFGETLSSAFRMLDNVQRGLVGLAFSFLDRPDRAWSEGLERKARRSSEPVRAAEALSHEDQPLAPPARRSPPNKRPVLVRSHLGRSA
jgi:hypothetical protein